MAYAWYSRNKYRALDHIYVPMCSRVAFIYSCGCVEEAVFEYAAHRNRRASPSISNQSYQYHRQNSILMPPPSSPLTKTPAPGSVESIVATHAYDQFFPIPPPPPFAPESMHPVVMQTQLAEECHDCAARHSHSTTRANHNTGDEHDENSSSSSSDGENENSQLGIIALTEEEEGREEERGRRARRLRTLRRNRRRRRQERYTPLRERELNTVVRLPPEPEDTDPEDMEED
ncbi:hypothetical protein F4810DRAFT_68312 [Camillea tinctor]|nr:hypothetical protein F4810DRAFT_68312 [Camillea tinctor]